MKPEENTRQETDHLLELVGWIVQDYREFNLGASIGVAVRMISNWLPSIRKAER